jgi:hypothetical protein
MGMRPQTVKERYQSIVDFSGVGDLINLAMKTYSRRAASREPASRVTRRGGAHVTPRRDRRVPQLHGWRLRG